MARVLGTSSTSAAAAAATVVVVVVVVVVVSWLAGKPTCTNGSALHVPTMDNIDRSVGSLALHTHSHPLSIGLAEERNQVIFNLTKLPRLITNDVARLLSVDVLFASVSSSVASSFAHL